jgi:hypothetical protein
MQQYLLPSPCIVLGQQGSARSGVTMVQVRVRWTTGRRRRRVTAATAVASCTCLLLRNARVRDRTLM